MKLALLTANHGQSLPVPVKLTLPLPPPADKDALLESRTNAHEIPA